MNILYRLTPRYFPVVVLFSVFVYFCSFFLIDEYSYPFSDGVRGSYFGRNLQERRNWYSLSSSYDGKLKAGVVDGGYLYLSNDLGNSWTLEIIDEARAWRAVTQSADGTRVAAVAYEGSIFSARTEEGANVPPQQLVWTEHTEDVNPGQHAWNAIAGSSNGLRLAVTAKNGLVYIGNSTYGVNGTDEWSWNWANYSTVPGEKNWAAITSNDDGSRYAAVVNGGYIYTYHEGSDTWTQQGSEGNWVSISCSRDGLILGAVDHGGYVYISENFGSQWIAQVDLGKKNWYAIAVSSDGKRMLAIDDDGFVFKATAAQFTTVWTEQGLGMRARWHALTLVERVAMFTLLLN